MLLYALLLSPFFGFDKAPQPGPVLQPQPAINWQMTVQETNFFTDNNRPAVSESAESSGLTVTIQPERQEFGNAGPLAFEVVLKNSSPKPFMLYRSDQLGENAKLYMSHTQLRTMWSLTVQGNQGAGGKSVTLKPGDTLKYSLVIQAQPVFVPQPVPLPQPVPVPFPRPVEETEKQPQFRRRPAPIFVASPLPIGAGQSSATLTLEFKASPLKIQFPHQHWTGKLTTKSTLFTVAGQPVPPVPPVIPPIAGPLTKEQAIARAHTIAEAALNQFYQPVEDVKPPHTGAWITGPEKTAQVKSPQPNTWLIQWTAFPKSGHSYNVTVSIDASGSTDVTEVFAGYSR